MQHIRPLGQLFQPCQVVQCYATFRSAAYQRWIRTRQIPPYQVTLSTSSSRRIEAIHNTFTALWHDCQVLPRFNRRLLSVGICGSPQSLVVRISLLCRLSEAIHPSHIYRHCILYSYEKGLISLFTENFHIVPFSCANSKAQSIQDGLVCLAHQHISANPFPLNFRGRDQG
jgi:hypothetical protein